jgi:glycosyltransferase involved in cell wall biosynthesis
MAPDVSVVIPIRNEAPGLAELHRELTDTLAGWGRSYELILIDDGSTDESFDVLARLQMTDPHLRVIRFRRNFGQTAAFAAGFDHARGRIIVTSDGDLQNDPRDIPAMVAMLESGYDIVCGWRKDRKDAFVTRRLPSMIANRLISMATGVRLHDYGCSLKVFRSEVVKPLKLYGEMHRFLPAQAHWVGARIGELPVGHRPRTRGKSKYGLWRAYRVLLDLVTVRFLGVHGTKPLHAFGALGCVFGALGVVTIGVLSYLKYTTGVSFIQSPLLLLSALFVILGGQSFLLGLLAEIAVRTYYESQQKPIYVVREMRRAGETGPPEDDPRHERRVSGAPAGGAGRHGRWGGGD